MLVAVAVVAAGMAAYFALQLSPSPAPAPTPEVVTQVVAAPTVQVLVAKQPMVIGRLVSAETVEWGGLGPRRPCAPTT